MEYRATPETHARREYGIPLEYEHIFHSALEDILRINNAHGEMWWYIQETGGEWVEFWVTWTKEVDEYAHPVMARMERNLWIVKSNEVVFSYRKLVHRMVPGFRRWMDVPSV